MKGIPGEIVRTKLSELEVFARGKEITIRKTAIEAGQRDVIEQAQFYQHAPPEVARHYPTLLGHNISKPPYWYEMPFYFYPSLRDVVHFRSDVPLNLLEDRITAILTFLFSKRYRLKSGGGGCAYFGEAFTSRLSKRLEQLEQSDSIIAQALSTKAIELQGNSLPHPSVAFQRIVSNVEMLHRLYAPRLVSIHGQLEFDHILVNTHPEPDVDFVLLDCQDRLGDPAYDLGKLWESLHSLVDFIKTDFFDLSYSIENDVLAVGRFVMPLERVSVSNRLYELARSCLTNISAETSDPHLLMRSDFAEAVHLATAGPFFYNGTEAGRKRALAF